MEQCNYLLKERDAVHRSVSAVQAKADGIDGGDDYQRRLTVVHDGSGVGGRMAGQGEVGNDRVLTMRSMVGSVRPGVQRWWCI